MESIHLHGAEDVRSAANTMMRAAEQMNHAASQIEYALQTHQRFMEDFLMRFEQAVGRVGRPTDAGPL